MRKICYILFSILSLLSLSGYSFNTDSSAAVKKSFQTIEICGGISPKAHRQYVTSSKGYVMYGLWYDYSRKIKNNFYASFVVNPLVGGDEFYNENSDNNGFSTLKTTENYLLLNMGIGFKYKLNLSKLNPQEHSLIFAVGDCFSYQYIYGQTSQNVYVLYNPPVNTSTYYSSKYNLWNNFNRFDGNKIAFPMFLKLSYYNQRITFSLTQYLFAQESMYGSDFVEKFYMNISVGVKI